MKECTQAKIDMGHTRPKRFNLARVARLSISTLCLLVITFSPFYYLSTYENSVAILASIKNLSLFGLGKDGDRFQFFDVRRSFAGRNLDLVRVSELTTNEFKDMILESTPIELRRRLRTYLDWTLEFSQKYQVDPFWVLAIMWTESHFRQNVQSYVNATGLMQIMPDTGHFLSVVMNKPVSPEAALNLIKEPRVNIEMGVVYLERLLKLFNCDYTLATVAYNLGPARVKDRLIRNQEVGIRNHYLHKVRRYYLKISSSYVSYLNSVPAPYIATLAVEPKMLVIPPMPQFPIVQEAWDLLTPKNLAELEKRPTPTMPIVSYL